MAGGLSPGHYFLSGIKMDELNLCVLIVEDNASIAKLLLLVFENNKFKTKWVFLGEKVLNACLEEVPDLIVFDPTLPDKDGFEVIKEIKNHIILKEIPVIFLLEEEEKQNLRVLPFSPLDIMVKPINLNELELRIKNWISFLENQKALKKAAMTDPLTGLMNNLALETELTLKCYHGEKFEKIFSTLMMDVDHFTRYNDIYGHQFGDSLLQVLAVFWCSLLRSADTLFRYKGGRFVAIIADANLERGMMTAERLRKATYERNLPHQRGIDNRVTISIGVTAFKKGDTAGTLLHRVATYLAEAKKSGRNVVKGGV